VGKIAFKFFRLNLISAKAAELRTLSFYFVNENSCLKYLKCSQRLLMQSMVNVITFQEHKALLPKVDE